MASWIKVCNLSNVTQTTRICYQHFKLSDFKSYNFEDFEELEQTFAENGQLGNLKKNVIPSRYLPEKLSDTDTGMYIFFEKKNRVFKMLLKHFFAQC